MGKPERRTEKRSHAKNAKDSKERDHEDKRGSRAVLGDLGVLERATASGREKRTRNGRASSRKGFLRVLRGTQPLERGTKDERGMGNGEAGVPNGEAVSRQERRGDRGEVWVASDEMDREQV